MTGSQAPGGTVEADAALPCARSSVSLDQTNLRPNNTEQPRQVNAPGGEHAPKLERQASDCWLAWWVLPWDWARAAGARTLCLLRSRHEQKHGMNTLDGVACAWYRTVLQGLVLALHGAAAAVPCDIKRQPRPFRWTKTGEYRMRCLASQGHPSISGRGHQTMHTCAIENGNYGGGGGTNRVTCPICCLVRSSSGPAAPRACAGGSLESCSAATTAPKPEPVSETRPIFAPSITT